MFRRFLFLEFFARLFRLRFEFQVLDDVFGSLRHYIADVVKSLAACTVPPCLLRWLVKDCRLVATVFAELRKEYRSNRNVYANAQCIRSANDFE